MGTLLQGWLEAAERLSNRAPDLARGIAAGSWPAEGLVALCGLALLVAGARLGRFLACAGGALVGWSAGRSLVPVADAWLPAWVPPWVGAGMLGLASLLAPSLYPLGLGLLPGLLLGLRTPIAGKEWLGGLTGAALLALLAMWQRRFVLVATAAVAGAILVALALLAASHHVPALLHLARRPTLLAAAAATLAVAGTAYQLGAGVGRGKRGAQAATRKLEVEDTKSP